MTRPIASHPADEVVRDMAIGAVMVRLVHLVEAGMPLASALEQIAAEERATTAYAGSLRMADC